VNQQKVDLYYKYIYVYIYNVHIIKKKNINENMNVNGYINISICISMYIYFSTQIPNKNIAFVLEVYNHLLNYLDVKYI